MMTMLHSFQTTPSSNGFIKTRGRTVQISCPSSATARDGRQLNHHLQVQPSCPPRSPRCLFFLTSRRRSSPASAPTSDTTVSFGDWKPSQTEIKDLIANLVSRNVLQRVESQKESGTTPDTAGCPRPQARHLGHLVQSASLRPNLDPAMTGEVSLLPMAPTKEVAEAST